MFNPFQAVERIAVRAFTSLPGKFRKKRRTAWSDPNRRRRGRQLSRRTLVRPRGQPVVRRHPVRPHFPHRPERRMGARRAIRRLAERAQDPQGRPDLHRRLQARADAARPEVGKIETRLETAFSEGFKGLNDLHFADNGDLYFTDQGQSGIADPTGRVFRLRASGELRPARRPTRRRPNGITLSSDEHQRLRRGHALAADLAAAADGRTAPVEDRRRDPALGRPCRPRRHRDGRRGRPRGLPPRRRRLALRFELPADPSRPRRKESPPDDQHRVRRRRTARRSTSPTR